MLKNFIDNFIKIVSTDKLLNMVPLTILVILFILTEKLMGVIMEVRFGSKLKDNFFTIKVDMLPVALSLVRNL